MYKVPVQKNIIRNKKLLLVQTDFAMDISSLNLLVKITLLLVVLLVKLGDGKVNPITRTCSRIECPSYDLVTQGDGYEIRVYNSSVWISTSPIMDISLVDATRTGFLQLFNYIQGKNDYKQQIEMTAPVMTEVLPSDGPFCKSSFVVSFFVPTKNQANPPSAEGLTVQKWKPYTYAAVRQFPGFVSDYEVGMEAAALQASLEGTVWSSAIGKTSAGDASSVYSVAQYNSPFEFKDRINEIWMVFDMESVHRSAW